MASYLMITFSGIFITCFLAFAIQIILFSPISPIPLEIPPPSLAFLAPSNAKLQEAIKLGEGQLLQPEDVAIDKAGILYTATRDGWIKRLHKNGTVENWWHIDSDGLLGLTVTGAGDLVVCDAEKGLLKVNEEGVTVLTSHVNGSKISFADDVVESWGGTLYFSVASTKFFFHNWELEVLEARPHGQLLKYDPSLDETSILLDDLGFANGVALSEQQDYLVVCESWKFRCLKYWLKGDIKGQTEIFIDNLPGAPDNIKLAPDGSYWIALIELIPSKLRFLHTSVALKYLIAPFPKLRKRAMIRPHTKAMVMNVASDGKMIRSFDDPTGKVMAFVTSALEFEDHLYLGNLHTNFIGKLPLI